MTNLAKSERMRRYWLQLEPDEYQARMERLRATGAAQRGAPPRVKRSLLAVLNWTWRRPSDLELPFPATVPGEGTVTVLAILTRTAVVETESRRMAVLLSNVYVDASMLPWREMDIYRRDRVK